MKKPIFLVMFFITIGLSSCTKEQADKRPPQVNILNKSPNPQISARFMNYVGLVRHGDEAKHRFSDFPDVPLEEAKELFDNIFAVYIPLRVRATWWYISRIYCKSHT